MRRIYLDYGATTPLDPASREAMLPWLDGGNPSSLYEEGRKARAATDEARETVSDALGCAFADVVFTSGGTEAANLAIVGVALRNDDPGRNRILLGGAEHHCVLHTRAILQRLGYQVDLVPVNREAITLPEQLEAVLSEDVLLTSVMHANNELGSINPIRDLVRVAHSHGALFHTDAVQTFLKPELRWRLNDLESDLVSVSAHKINGPKAVGALYVAPGVKPRALVGGGGQERELRGGTENVAGIVGFAAAVRAHGHAARLIDSRLRDRFLDSLESVGAVRTVRKSHLLNAHAHVRFPGRDAGSFLIALDRLGISASSGAACSSGSIEPSHVLLACGYSAGEAKEGVRFTLSSSTTASDLEEAIERIEQAIGGRI